MEDHRKFKRVAKEHLVSFEKMAEDLKTVVNRGVALELNLSKSGLQMDLPVEVQEGDVLALSIAIEEHMVDVSGEVVWVAKGDDLWHVGCKLIGYPTENAEMIQSWWNDLTDA
jgi:hypothetical protein